MTGRLRGLGLATALLAVSACASPTTPSGSPPQPSSSPVPGSTSSGIAPSSVAHQIGVRTVDGAGEFFDRTTGLKFVPRGFNWVHLRAGNHASFDAGVYDPAEVDAGFARIAGLGYNTVRVFFNTYVGGILGETTPLSAPYLDNVADFLGRAANHGLFVILTQDELVDGHFYDFHSDPLIEDINAVYLSKGGVEASVRYFGDLARELLARDARLDALLAYEIRNELYFTSDHAPFSLSKGMVTTANGMAYDMALRDDHTRMLEDNLLNWIERSRSAILAVDPTALVTIGFFQPQGPVPSRVGDNRLIETRRAIVDSSADFIDLHGYPGGELNLADIVTNFKLPATTTKPILMGEFGAETSAYPGVDDAVRTLVNWQIESCTYGFDGWLEWLWDDTDQPEFWGASNGDGQIADALAPSQRPDPCNKGSLSISTDLASTATAKASSGVKGYPPSNAIDGLADTYWNASAGPPQWIEIDLGSERTVDEIRLQVMQDPAGPSRHVLSVRSTDGQWRDVHVFKGVTQYGDLLDYKPDSALDGVRYVRVETTALPAGLWPAWREINILGR